MDYKGAVDLAILLGQLEEKITALPEWEAVRDADPKLWDHCDAGYDSVAVFINTQHERLDAVVREWERSKQ